MRNKIIWSDWILHDGKGCPCIGSLVEVEHAYEEFFEDSPYDIGYMHYAVESGHWYYGNQELTQTWSKDSEGYSLVPIVKYRIALNEQNENSPTTLLMQMLHKPERK